MKVCFHKAARVEKLLEELCHKVSKPSQRVHDIFNSHGIFVPNPHGKAYVQEYFLSHSPNSMVGNVHFMDWSLNLGYLLEKEDSLFSSKEILFLVLGKFLKEICEHPFPGMEFLETSASLRENLFLWGEYYYNLFLEYEVFLPEFLDPKDHLHREDLLSEKASFHRRLYKTFWEWMDKKFSFLRSTIPYYFLYPRKKPLQNTLKKMKEVHIFLPKIILFSQLKFLQETMKIETLNVYIQDNPLLYNIPGYLYQKEDLIAYWKKICQELHLEYEEKEWILETSRPPRMDIFSLQSASLEEEDLLDSTVRVLEEHPKTFTDQYSIVFSKGGEHARLWEKIFGPHGESLPTHFLSLQQYLKNYDIYQALEYFLIWSQTQKSFEGFSKILNLPLIQNLLQVSSSDIQTFLKFLQQQEAYGESSLYPPENQLSYPLSRYKMAHFLDTPKEYAIIEIPENLLSFSLTLLKKGQLRWTQKDVSLCSKDLQDLRDFLEFFSPASFWKELDDPYIRKDMLYIHQLLGSLEAIFPYIDHLESSVLHSFLLHAGGYHIRQENLSFTKRKGMMVGTVEDFTPLPITYLRFSQFSENFSLTHFSTFHQESCLKEKNPYLVDLLKKSEWAHFLELLTEASHVCFSYHEKDPLTQQPLKPHFLVSVLENLGWGKRASKQRLSRIVMDDISVKELSVEESEELKQNSRPLLSIREFYRFLQFPLKERLERLAHRGLFLDSLDTWTQIPYFFATSTPKQRKFWERVLLKSFYNEEIFKETFKKIQSSAQGGSSRYSEVWVEGILQQKQKIFSFLEMVEMERECWGDYYHHISIGPYQNSLDPLHLIFPPVNFLSKKMTGELFHVYLKTEEKRAILTLPNVYQEKKGPLSIRMLLSFMLCGLSLQKEQLVLRILYPSPEFKLEVKTYVYEREEIFKYFSESLERREKFTPQPFSLYHIKQAYRDQKKDAKREFWEMADLSSLIEEVGEDFLSSLNLPWISKNSKEVIEELKGLYSLLFRSPLAEELL